MLSAAVPGYGNICLLLISLLFTLVNYERDYRLLPSSNRTCHKLAAELAASNIKRFSYRKPNTTNTAVDSGSEPVEVSA